MGGTTLSSYMGGYPAQQPAQQPSQQFLQNIYGGAPRQMSYQDAASLAFGYDPYGAALKAATQPRYAPPPMPPAAKPTAGPDAGVTAPAGGGGGDANPETMIASGGAQRRGGRIGHSKDVRAAMLTARGMKPDEHARHRSPAVHPASLIPGIHVRSFATGGDVEPTDETGFDAYHGTPHEFAPERLVQHPTGQQEYMHASQPVPEGASVLKEFPLGRFRLDRIGTGEGAQSYGHGLYLGEKGTAQVYREKLSKSANPNYLWDAESAYQQLKKWESNHDWIKEQIAEGNMSADSFDARHSERKLQEARKKYDAATRPPGHLYHVRVNANPAHFLDWDKPLSEQSEHVREALKSFYPQPNIRDVGYDPNLDAHLADVTLPGGGTLGVWDKSRIPTDPSELRAFAMKNDPRTGGQIYESRRIVPGDYRDPVAASQRLREAGIPGIRYLDAMSRGPTGAPTYNHVIFDPSIIDIKHRYKRGGEVAPHDQTLPPNPHKHDTTRRSGGHVARALRLAHSLNPVPPGRLRP